MNSQIDDQSNKIWLQNVLFSDIKVFFLCKECNRFMRRVFKQYLYHWRRVRVDLGAVQTVFPATGQETVKRIIIIKKGTPVPVWKKCLSGNPSCLSLFPTFPHLSHTLTLSLSDCLCCSITHQI